MKKKRRYRANPVFSVVSVLLCLTLLSTWLTFGLFAQYTTSGSSESSAVVAVMASDVDITLDELLLYPGINKTFQVELTNKENGVVCEVSQSYSFNVKQLADNLPLGINVYTDQACSTPATLDADGNATGAFTASTENTETYYIKVSWDESENAAYYANEIDYLRLSVTVTQID